MESGRMSPRSFSKQMRYLSVCLMVLSHRYLSQAVDLSQCYQTGTAFNCSSINLLEIPNILELTPSPSILDFSYNSISKVNLQGFRNNVTLHITVLNISHNKISDIHDEAFRLFSNVKILDLSSNLIQGKTLRAKAFWNMLGIEVLNLECNPLRYIERDTFTFTEMESLGYLDLSHCEIEEMETSAINLPKLVHLDLSWNKLRTVEKSLEMMVNLKTLDLSHNLFTDISDFPLLPRLDMLNLDSNNIQHIDIRTSVYQNVDNLQVLSLRNNNLKLLRHDAIPWDLDTLLRVDLHNNPIMCDCGLKWITTNPFVRAKNVTMRCTEPKQLRGRGPLELSRDDFICYSPFTMIIIIAGLSTLLVFAVVGAVSVAIIKRKRSRKSAISKDGGGNFVAIYSEETDKDDANVVIQTENKTMKGNDAVSDDEV
ncbi:hypothetical protein CHS0354_016151 [Potamilus streckersoni]|uniref:LRRCT domain-containing protein n=1 Tax=Potamilus streckersoni TaxID=2493646 RepID=A0AAE0SQQ4_9BIVA|nr:hypothetical protein CHS0354_016151 [Potamilus streckersoni]